MRKFALFSDVHSNYKALEAFLEYIERHPVEGVIGLGDYVTDGPYPERTLALIYGMQKRYPCYLVRGNREDYLLDNEGNKEGWKPSSSNGTLYYTHQRITEADRKFFTSLPTEREVRIEGCPVLYICHGTPGRVRGNVREEEGLWEKVMGELAYAYLLGGHSHHQEIRRQQGKTYINPGSLGLAIDGVGGRAQFAVLTGEENRWEAELKSIPYDMKGYLESFTESGLDEIGLTLNKAVKKSVSTGINYFFKCILAMEEERKKAGVISMSEMPQEAWDRMEERFGL